MTETQHDNHGREDEHHGINVYLWVFGALLVLTSASVFTYTDFWRERVPIEIGWTFMMAVSCTKALLVASFFMHLKWEANWKYVLTIPATIMSIFLILMLVPDVGLRTEKYSIYREVHAPCPPLELHLGEHHESEGDAPKKGEHH
jgi:cytochrome c oxidase subunit 4